MFIARLVLVALAALAGCAPRGPMAAPSDLALETSVRPGINERWMSEEIEPLIESLETESREIFVHREAIAAVAGPRPGSVVADVGAGSGFMAWEFAKLVGASGTVYAVDINAAMMEHVAQEAARRSLANVETVVCGERSVNLPRNAIDMVFICDTYHHFEYPRATLRSIHQALRPGGQIVLVEFDRVPGSSRPWIIDHVRAGRDVFIAEIEAAGFDLINAHDAPFLEENYILRFRKPG